MLVHAIVNLFGSTDFVHMLNYECSLDHVAPDSPENLLLEGPATVVAANPITYISSAQTYPLFMVQIRT